MPKCAIPKAYRKFDIIKCKNLLYIKVVKMDAQAQRLFARAYIDECVLLYVLKLT